MGLSPSMILDHGEDGHSQHDSLLCDLYDLGSSSPFNSAITITPPFSTSLEISLVKAFIDAFFLKQPPTSSHKSRLPLPMPVIKNIALCLKDVAATRTLTRLMMVSSDCHEALSRLVYQDLTIPIKTRFRKLMRVGMNYRKLVKTLRIGDPLLEFDPCDLSGHQLSQSISIKFLSFVGGCYNLRSLDLSTVYIHWELPHTTRLRQLTTLIYKHNCWRYHTLDGNVMLLDESFPAIKHVTWMIDFGHWSQQEGIIKDLPHLVSNVENVSLVGPDWNTFELANVLRLSFDQAKHVNVVTVETGIPKWNELLPSVGEFLRLCVQKTSLHFTFMDDIPRRIHPKYLGGRMWIPLINSVRTMLCQSYDFNEPFLEHLSGSFCDTRIGGRAGVIWVGDPFGFPQEEVNEWYRRPETLPHWLRTNAWKEGGSPLAIDRLLMMGDYKYWDEKAGAGKE